jgi:hypothetical protein
LRLSLCLAVFTVSIPFERCQTQPPLSFAEMIIAVVDFLAAAAIRLRLLLLMLLLLLRPQSVVNALSPIQAVAADDDRASEVVEDGGGGGGGGVFGNGS